MEKETGYQGISRRGFLKTSAAAMAGSALAGSSLTAVATAADATTSVEQEFAGVCRGNCMGNCPIKVFVRDGKVVRTAAQILEDDYSRICARGLTHPVRMYSPKRLKYPMRRKEGTERGAGEWERITWEEAINEVATKWKQYTEQYGPESFIMSVGSGAYGICNGVPLNSHGGVERLRWVTGAANLTNPVDRAHGVGMTLSVIVDMGMTGNEPKDYVNSKTIICWGANPVISQPHNFHFIMDAKQKGAKYIVIDPSFNINASRADWFIPIRAQTDSLLAIGMMKLLVDNGWQDVDFLANHTNAPFLVKQDGTFLRMYEVAAPVEGVEPDTSPAVWDPIQGIPVPCTTAVNPAITGITDVFGIPVTTSYDLLLNRLGEYSYDMIETETTIPHADMVELTRIYVKEGPSAIYLNMGDDHYYQGHTHYQAIYVLAEMAGMMGRPGAQCGAFEYMTSFVINEAFAAPPDAPGDGQDYLFSDMEEILNTGMFNGKPQVIKGAYFSHGNILTSMADRDHTLEWLKKLEFIVVAELTMCEIARYADILLPAAWWFEEEDIFWSYETHPFIAWNDKATEPAYESKPDFEIVSLIAKALGVGKWFDMTPREFMDGYLDTDYFHMFGVNTTNLSALKVMRAVPPNFINFAGGYFMSCEAGRGQLYTLNVYSTYGYQGADMDYFRPRLPYFAEPPEVWYKGDLYKKYPFHVLSEHDRFRTHSQWFDTQTLLELEPECTAKMNHLDADKLGLKDGDYIKLYNDRGFVVLRLVINNGIRPGMVYAQKGWQEGEYVAGHFSALTSHKISPYVSNFAFNEVQVAIEKWEGSVK
ncbi:MAG: molybdopterin-dependent oxidoreductase [Eggerthellaceae bacterium]|nr:molybdopterin-dependent oxidoreductase [Eggerthellaceae bacterium]